MPELICDFRFFFLSLLRQCVSLNLKLYCWPVSCRCPEYLFCEATYNLCKYRMYIY